MTRKPPLLARRLLQLFVHVHYLEEVEGDLEEIFGLNIKKEELDNGSGALLDTCITGSPILSNEANVIEFIT